MIFFLLVGVVVFNFSAKKDVLNPEEYSPFGATSQLVGKYPPDFLIPLLNGDEFSLSETIGKKVIIINFFATWCTPCAEEMPELSEFYTTHKNEDLIMIGIALDEEKKVRAFTQKYQVAFPAAVDSGGEIQSLYRVNSFPVTILIGADGIIKLYQSGQIMNAEVAFDKIYQEELQAIKANKGISEDTYLKKIQKQGEGKSQPMLVRSVLPKRIRTIAKSIKCPCHRTISVLACRCGTADEIIEDMKKMKMDQMTDEQVIENLKTKYSLK